MKNGVSWWSYLGVMGIAFAGLSNIAAAEGTQRIAFVDVQKVLQVADAGKKAREQLEKEVNAKKAEFQKEEAAIKKMNESFQKQSLAMNDETRSKKQAELQNRVIKLQQAFQQSQEELQLKERSLTQPIVGRLRAVIKELAKKKNYSVVLERNENLVLFSEEKDDLTSEVILAFDKGGKSE
jgi:outer membrane protein